MSAEAVGWVYRRSPYEGATFAVHLAIADTANDVNGYEFWMGLGKLAAKARVSRPTVQRAVDTLVADGLLEVMFASNGGRGRPSRYRLNLPERPAVWEPRAPGGDPEKLPSDLAVSGGETAKPAGETVNLRATHRTQEEPKKKDRRPVCTACGDDFAGLDELYAHVETLCPVLHDDR